MSGPDLPTNPPALHPRTRRQNRYVYAVRARRSRGISIGINLDPQKTCNFDCVYCEVIDRRDLEKSATRPAIAAAEVVKELTEELSLHRRIAPSYEADPVRDISFAGDGEPSTFRGFLPLAHTLFELCEKGPYSAGLNARVLYAYWCLGLTHKEKDTPTAIKVQVGSSSQSK